VQTRLARGLTVPAAFSTPPIGIGVVLLVALALRAPLLAGGQIDYDEGVYWQSLRSLAAGHQLFASVYSSQPPAFLLTLTPAYLLLGGTIVAARTTVLVVALLGIAAAGRAVWLLAGPAAGLLAAGLVAADPLLFRQSVTLQADGPAIALGLVAVAAAAEARRHPGRLAILLAVGAGAALAVAVLTKLLAAAAFPAVIVLLVAPPITAPSAIRLLGAAALGCVVATAALLLPFIGVWSDLWAEAVSFHLGARSVGLGGLDAPTYLSELPIAALGAVGFLIALWRAPLLAATGAAWTVSATLMLFVQRPLWPHHAVVLAAPLALVAGAVAIALTPSPGFAGYSPDLPRRKADFAGTPGAGERLRRPAAVGFAVLLLAASVGSAVHVRTQQEPAAEAEATVAALRASTAPGDLVISDDQFATALAGRSTPPELVDTSLVRVKSGDLTVDELMVIAERWHVRAVLLRTDRLAAVPGLQAWLEQHFPKSMHLGTGRTLYLR
jgi:hypothetical protein